VLGWFEKKKSSLMQLTNDSKRLTVKKIK